MKTNIFIIIILISLIFCTDKNEIKKSMIEFIEIEKGSFNMGSNNGDADEKPVHEVIISKSFYMSKYKITAKQAAHVLNWGFENEKLYIEKMDSETFVKVNDKIIVRLNPGYLHSHIKYDNEKIIPVKGKEDHPVIGFNWYGAAVFCNLLSEMENRNPVYNLKTWKANFNKNGYRLPTEAQWEFAAKGGNLSKNYIYSGSNNIDDVAWYKQQETQPVGLKKPNELGLYDMSGNLYEWCNDWYDKNYYSNSKRIDPSGPPSGEFHVRRSCVWFQKEFHNRITDRIYGAPFCNSMCGFRIIYID